MNCRAYGELNLRGKYLETPLVVPFLPSWRKAGVLSSSSASSELLLFFSKFERDQFEKRGKQIGKNNRFLAELNSKTFSTTPLESVFSRVEKEIFTGAEEPAPEMNDLVEKVLQERISSFSKQSGDATTAVPIYFNDSAGLVFLAPGSNVFLENVEEKQYELSEARLVFCDRFCIPLDSKSDMLDELALLGTKNYREHKKNATAWKERVRSLLRNHFQNNIAQFRDYLTEHGIHRGEQTLKNWLNDSSLIAPRDHEDIFVKFSDLPGFGEPWRAQCDLLIDAVTMLSSEEGSQ